MGSPAPAVGDVDNDGRVDLTQKPTLSDRSRINTRFVSVLCDGFPAIFVETTRKIKKNEALWSDYGESYHEVFDSFDNILRRQRKMTEKTERILINVDLKETEPIDLSLVDFANSKSIPPSLDCASLSPSVCDEETSTKHPRNICVRESSQKKTYTHYTQYTH